VVIRDESSGGGASAADANRAIDIPDSVTNSTIVDGVTVYGGGGEHSTAIYSAGSPKIQNCKIFAGSTGIAGDYRYGLYASAGVSELTSCNINNGSGGNSAVEKTFGIYTESGSSIRISRCKISGGTANAESYGIFGAGTLVEKSEIDGGSSTWSAGVSVESVCEIELRNNLFHSAALPSNVMTSCICINSGSEVNIRNNTFILENVANSNLITEHGIYILLRNVLIPISIDNNLFVMEGTASNLVYGIYNDVASSNSDSLQNNGFAGFTLDDHYWLYRDRFNTKYSREDIDDINLLNFASANVYGTAYLDDEEKLTTTSQPEFQNGGIDGVAAGWGFSDDCFGVQRTGNGTTGWSMGFSEY